MKHLALTLVALPLIVVQATCAHRPKDVAAPDRASVLELVERTPPVPAQRVLAGERGAYVLSSGGVFAATFSDGPRGEISEQAESTSWVDAVEIDAFEGSGRWSLAVDASGTIHRLRGGGGLEPMNDRLGVGKHARRLRAAGRALAVLADEGLFVVDRTHVVRFDVHGRELAASRGAVAVLDEDAVRYVDLETKRARSFSIDGPRAVALTASGVLVVATDAAIYRENGSGELALRYVADDDLGALAIEGERVWFSDGARVGLLDDAGAKLTGAVGTNPITQIAPTASDVWIVDAKGARRLVRPGDVFPEDVARIAQAACVPCHRPTRVEGGGPFDLSTSSAFRAHRDDVIKALTAKEMPPRGRVLSDVDRARLVEWTRSR